MFFANYKTVFQNSITILIAAHAERYNDGYPLSKASSSLLYTKNWFRK